MQKGRSGREILLIVIGIFLGLYVLYHLLIWCAKASVYLGYNMFFYLDNLFTITALNPLISWGIFGFFLGIIFGVLVAIRKYRLRKSLIFIPVAFFIVLLVIMSLINQPANYAGTYGRLPEKTGNSVAEPAPAVKYFYKVVSDSKVRSGPSVKHPRLFTIVKGAEVEVDQPGSFDATRIQWIKIRYNRQEGYISSRQLRYSRSGYE